MREMRFSDATIVFPRGYPGIFLRIQYKKIILNIYHVIITSGDMTELPYVVTVRRYVTYLTYLVIFNVKYLNIMFNK